MPSRRGLFDTGLRRSPPPGDEPQTGKAKAWTVSQLTRRIKECLEEGFAGLWVEGEISNYRSFASGHCYFTLKDEGAQLPAVLWRDSAARLRFTPQDGDKVLACGHLSVYEARGAYQLIVETMEPLGMGALAAAFERLKARLAAEGLFDEARKRPLPRYPWRIGIVTSPDGAAIRDLLKVVFSRWPAEIILAGVRVQGEGAAAEIAAAIGLLNRLEGDDRPEALVVGRGGGSLEDLWAFNEEAVARAIAASRIPVISAVGHEVDFTIADFVADVRAATPSHAGEIVVPRLEDVREHLRTLETSLPAALLRRVEVARQRLDALAQSYALRHPEERAAVLRQRLDDLASRLAPAGERRASVARERLASLAGRLESLSPLRVLERGYSLTTRERDCALVTSPRDVAPGESLRTRVRGGTIVSRVAGTGRADP
ncbi:MAG: exodeoxyribonuclease VII large subunit [Planctomycetota bacterium]|nr:exodeoxyribonuclease VII large subunit [Planctomycetota bacterium]